MSRLNQIINHSIYLTSNWAFLAKMNWLYTKNVCTWQLVKCAKSQRYLLNWRIDFKEDHGVSWSRSKLIWEISQLSVLEVYFFLFVFCVWVWWLSPGSPKCECKRVGRHMFWNTGMAHEKWRQCPWNRSHIQIGTSYEASRAWQIWKL